MQLVKSCNKDKNALRCNTLKFGTLQEYIQTEQKQIADEFEGTFWTHVDLENIEAEANDIHALTRGHHGSVALHGVNLEIGGSSRTPGKTVYKTVKSKIHHNSSNGFIFCMSLLDNQEDAIGLFPDYDDYWYTNALNELQLSKFLLSSLTEAIKRKEESGEKVFDGNYTLDDIECRIKYDKIYYRERINYVTNSNYEDTKDEVIKCVTGTSWIKPLDFPHEKEFRFGFYFFHNNQLLTPIINYLIAPTHPFIKMMCRAK